MSEARIAMLGLPRTGKSSYLGTLWHFVEEPSIDEITEIDIEGDRKHVQELADHMRALTDFDRTSFDEDERFEVDVEFADAGTVQLVIPDRSGEQLQSLVERREWPHLLSAELEAASGLMVFVHPDELHPPLDLRVAPAGAEPGEYENKEACTAAQVVDGLENVIEAMTDRWPLNVALVISAFDRVSDTSPDEWLRKRLPAVGALMESDPARVRGAVFGVCAQGGSREDRDTVLALGPLHERAWAQGGDGSRVGFSNPVRWALGW